MPDLRSPLSSAGLQQGSVRPRRKKEKWQPKSAKFNPPPGWDEFMERNHNSTTDIKQFVTIEQKQELQKMRDEAAGLGLDLGNNGTEGFKKLLTYRFGSVIRGWRFGLDVAGNNRLSFAEFCTSCRNMGFDGNLLGLWNALDDDKSGVVPLAELEPRAHHCTELFRQLLRQKYGNTLKAWKYGLDENGNDRVDLDELEAVCKKIKYPHDVKELFEYLIPDAGRPFLCIEDVDRQAQVARDRGDWNMITVPHAPKEIEVDMDDVFASMNKRPDEDLKKKDEEIKKSDRVAIQDQGGGRNFEWNLYLSNQQKNALELRRQKQLPKDVGPKNLGEFKRTLAVRYGSMYLAWRYGLYISGDGKLCFQEFCAAARANEFRGSLLKVWKELDDDNSGVVTLEEFDPKAHQQVELMRSTLLDKFPNLLQAWQKGLDLDGNGRLDEHEWIARFQDMGFEGNAKYLFHLLKPKTRVFMTIDDFDAGAASAMQRGDDEMMTVVKPTSNPLAMTFQERNDNIFSLRWKKQLNQLKLKEMDARDRELVEKNKAGEGIDGFVKILKRRYGSIYRAWRQGLDTSGDGKLSFTEFTDACRAIGYAGHVRKLWGELDDDDSGVISLAELDPYVNRIVNQFFNFFLTKYQDNMISAWVECFDRKKKNRVTVEEFVDACVTAGCYTKK